MSDGYALAALSALGQPTRLAIFKSLVRQEPKGLAAGELAKLVGCPHNTFSTHIGILSRANLVYGTREGRSIVYRADAGGIRSLITYLVKDCCNDRPDLCGLAASESEKCGCVPQPTKRRRK
jgi:DNA-binding transcriptional ArsR family regulator